MFTIKHITVNGNEFASEYGCYSVQVIGETICGSDPCPPKRVRVQGFVGSTPDGDAAMTWTGYSGKRRPDASELHVMNRFGATIASFYLSDRPSPKRGETIRGYVDPKAQLFNSTLNPVA